MALACSIPWLLGGGVVPATHSVPTFPSQLQETLVQRQEELTTLQESNLQLKELATQARQLAAVLDVSATTQSGLAAIWSLEDGVVWGCRVQGEAEQGQSGTGPRGGGQGSVGWNGMVQCGKWRVLGGADGVGRGREEWCGSGWCGVG